MKRAGSLFLLLFGLVLIAGLAGCGSDDHINIFHAVFLANDAHLDYTTTTGFVNMGFGGYSISYDEDRNHPSSGKNYLQIALPTDVRAGQVFDNPSHRSLILYQDAHGGWHDARSFGSTMRIEVISWGGPGHYGRGTFEATLIDEWGRPAVIITQGTFEGYIHN